MISKRNFTNHLYRYWYYQFLKGIIRYLDIVKKFRNWLFIFFCSVSLRRVSSLYGSNWVKKSRNSKKDRKQTKRCLFKATPNEDWMIPEECWQGNVWPALYLTVWTFYGTVNINVNVHTWLTIQFLYFCHIFWGILLNFYSLRGSCICTQKIWAIFVICCCYLIHYLYFL